MSDTDSGAKARGPTLLSWVADFAIEQSRDETLTE